MGELTARIVLVLAPLLAFNALPLPGAAAAGMALPALVLAATYVRTTGNRVPVWEMTLLAVLALSVTWSDDPNLTAERLQTYLPLLVATVLGCCVVSQTTAMRCLQTSFVLIMGISAVRLLLLPASRARGQDAELVLTAGFSKNVFGGLLVVALLLLVGQRKRSMLVMAPVLIVGLALNQSATAWVVATFLVLATVVIRRILAGGKPKVAGPVLAITAVAGVAGTSMLALSNVDAAVSALGKDPTLGRRTEIWAACVEKIHEAPWLGHGGFVFLEAGSGSPVTEFVQARFQGYQPPHPHNGLLDLWGQLGLLGVLVFGALLLHAVRRGVPRLLAGDEHARTALLILAFILFFGVTEPTYLRSWLVLTVICVAIADPQLAPTARRPVIEEQRVRPTADPAIAPTAPQR